jgi:hypothetical protein
MLQRGQEKIFAHSNQNKKIAPQWRIWCVAANSALGIPLLGPAGHNIIKYGVMFLPYAVSAVRPRCSHIVNARVPLGKYAAIFTECIIKKL